MQLHSTIALAALAAALAIPGAAQARTRAHHHPARAESGLRHDEQLELAQQQIAQLQAQLNAVQARMDQQASAAAVPSPAAEQAVATAQAASAKADTALAAAQAAKASVSKTDHLVDAMKWAADTKISGRTYMNFSTIHQQTGGVDNLANGTGFNIKRVYIGIDHKFNNVFALNFTTDIANVTGSGAYGNVYAPGATPVGKGVYIKKAYLEAKLNPAFVVRLGAADLPWVPYAEGQYGYRHIENVLIDRTNYGTSADWGVHVGGDLFNKLISYQVSVVDGAGYRTVRVTKDVDVEARVSAQYKGFFAAVGGYTGKLGNGYQQAGTPAAPNIALRTAKRADGMIGFKNAQFTLGGEYFYAKDWKNVTVNPAPAANAYSQDSAQGYSVFGNYNVTPKWSLFGRYDWVKPNGIVRPTVKDHYFNVGLQYEPVKIVDLALVYKREAVNNGAIGTQNGTIGCATAETAHAFATAAAQAAGACAGDGTYDEVGLFAQVRF